MVTHRDMVAEGWYANFLKFGDMYGFSCSRVKGFIAQSWVCLQGCPEFEWYLNILCQHTFYFNNTILVWHIVLVICALTWCDLLTLANGSVLNTLPWRTCILIGFQRLSCDGALWCRSRRSTQGDRVCRQCMYWKPAKDIKSRCLLWVLDDVWCQRDAKGWGHWACTIRFHTFQPPTTGHSWFSPNIDTILLSKSTAFLSPRDTWPAKWDL